MDNGRFNGATRRGALRAGLLGAAGLVLGGASRAGAVECSAFDMPLPPASPDPQDTFGVDLAINVENIDGYLGRSDTVYRDMRMLRDPGDFEAIGGSPNLDVLVDGFKVVPFPYVATLPQMNIDGCYDGPVLFEVVWGGDNRSVVSCEAAYLESGEILEELFPCDKNIFLMCGGGGYADMMRILLDYLGWDASRIYNLGGAWGYSGERDVRLVEYGPDGVEAYKFWRADCAVIDFATLTPVPRPDDGGEPGGDGDLVNAEQIAAARAAQQAALGSEPLPKSAKSCAVR